MAHQSLEASVEHLLAELCARLGLCLASRAPADCAALVERGAGPFTDAVLAAERLDPQAEQGLRGQALSLVERHMARWGAPGAA